MKAELSLFIIWQNGRYQEQKILNDIRQKYEIKQTFEINWSEKNFSENISRFYGKKLASGCKKEKLCGKGKFLLVVVLDNNPLHINGINQNIKQSKYQYRQWTGGGHLVHGTDNYEETCENLLCLLGIDNQTFLEQYSQPWDGSTIEVKQDLAGTPNWNNENELINFIKKIPNLEISKIGYNYLIKAAHLKKAQYFLNAKQIGFIFKSSLHKINIAGKSKLIYIKKHA